MGTMGTYPTVHIPFARQPVSVPWIAQEIILQCAFSASLQVSINMDYCKFFRFNMACYCREPLSTFLLLIQYGGIGVSLFLLHYLAGGSITFYYMLATHRINIELKTFSVLHLPFLLNW